MSVTRPHRFNDETGAILPIFGLLIIVLMMFAAFAVDLGAMWAERRQLQSAADAGAMAAVFPLAAVGDSVASTAMDYVDNNTGAPVDRMGCAGWTPASEGVAGTFALVDGAESNCVWISTETTAAETLVAVKVPTQQVPTSFARVIGINSLAVDAFAVAQIQSQKKANILPFALKPNPTGNECLGSPPGGLSRDPCSGGTTGNYGYLTSWLHGSSDLGTLPSCGPGGLTQKDITEINIAIGTDHPVQNDIKWPADNAGADADNPDECDGTENPKWIPDSVDFCVACGMNELHAGLVSNTLFYGHSSRLQQPHVGPPGPGDGVDNTRTIAGAKKSDDLVLDNIGLWEYVQSGAGLCDPVALSGTGGPAATTWMTTCLNQMAPDVTFHSELWSSPRFAVVPELWATYPAGNSTPRAIKQFRGVYLNATWFNCSAAGSASDCLLFEDIDGLDQEVFYPGEGDLEACNPLGASGKCGVSQIQGLSSFVLPVAAVPDDVLLGLSPNARLLFR